MEQEQYSCTVVPCSEVVLRSTDFKIISSDRNFEKFFGYPQGFADGGGVYLWDILESDSAKLLLSCEKCADKGFVLTIKSKLGRGIKTFSYFQDAGEDRLVLKAVRVSAIASTGIKESVRQEYEMSFEDTNKLIDRLSTLDPLTGIYNFKNFSQRLSSILSNKSKRVRAVVYSDIDNFSYVNAYFGYEAGNKLLADFSGILKKNENVVLAGRLYCDMFIYVIEANDQQEIYDIIEAINDNYSSKVKKSYPKSDIFVSSGVYFIKDGDLNPRIVIDNANLARRNIKGDRNVPFGTYSEDLRINRIKEQEVATNIHMAIENGEIEAFLQPKFTLDKRQIIGAEALARWRNPDGSYRAPASFVNILEQVGYIVDMDWEIYRQTLECLRRWIDSGYHVVPISVNFSRLHNNYPDFVGNVIKMADEYNVPHSLIEIEITESALAHHFDNMVLNLNKLREDGFKVDMDDFGTGYSSLSFLANAPVDVVKVDRTFVKQVDISEKNREYVRHLCEFIKITGKDIVFEGVEAETQAEFFIKCGYNVAQGWIFDKAIPISEFERKYIFTNEKVSV